ncbi:MAG: WD40/YVTN/BNR-like repeat-containing protein [Gemmatimonas sp.]|jgi:photosystem II stability/assembly factor-like uncharacterized protein|uniref:WD40/YVTN/BNR-like repeat-containing protein n=1 Tax=Gemmatimonas sp. TaxID=1962908 RepID=UPI00391FB132
MSICLCARQAIVIAAVCTVAIAVSGTAQGAPRITELTSGVTPLLQAVHAASSTVVWASGHGGIVLRTVDGGTTWERRVTPAGDSLEFRDVHALGADTAWILSAGNGAKSRIYRTTDGGTTWALQFLNPDTAAFYDCLSFGSRAEGVAFGDASHGRTNLLRTDDGGRRWRLLAPSTVPAPLAKEGAFAASGLCVGHGDAKTVYVATGAPGARLFRSRDAGRTWSVENTPLTRGIAAGLTGLSFVDGTRGLVVAADINRLRTDTSRAVVGLTTDGGRTWDVRARPPLPGALAGVAWVPAAGREIAVAAGYGGAFFTLDEARSWTTITDRVTTGVSASGRTAWVVGANGRIWRLDW